MPLEILINNSWVVAYFGAPARVIWYHECLKARGIISRLSAAII